MITQNISTISDLRFKTKDVLAKAAKEPVFLFHRATPKGVLLSISEYEELMNTLEDFYLSLRAEDYEKENKQKIKWVNERELQKQLNKD